MTKNLDNEGLRSIADNYQLFYVDLWGVVHNGVTLHLEACLLYTSPSPRDGRISRMPSSA